MNKPPHVDELAGLPPGLEGEKPKLIDNADRFGLPSKASALLFQEVEHGRLDVQLIFPEGSNPKAIADQPTLAAMNALQLLLDSLKSKG